MNGVKPRIAVLGAGIMGSSLAMFLARQRCQVTVFDKAEQPLSAASRWNEGKIHLGFLYNADESLRTARHVMPGGLRFRPLVEELIGCSIEGVISEQDDVFLCHRDSVVQPDAMELYMQQVTELLRAHPDAKRYLADVSNAQARRFSDSELAAISGSDSIIAGFHVPERSVETTWLSDRFVDALAQEPQIELHLNTRVSSVRSQDGGDDGPWEINTSAGDFAGFDYVINALWEGRMAIDQTAGIEPQGTWSNRYRQSLFLRTKNRGDTPCVVIATGPFGDVKNYNGRDFYLSWYPAGLRADTSDVAPPELEELEMLEPEAMISSVFENLAEYLPWITHLRDDAEAIRVEGGWVFAAGRGSLSERSSTLHRRSDYGVRRKGTYLSVDTGKYSTAPWLARSLADDFA